MLQNFISMFHKKNLYYSGKVQFSNIVFLLQYLLALRNSRQYISVYKCFNSGIRM